MITILLSMLGQTSNSDMQVPPKTRPNVVTYFISILEFVTWAIALIFRECTIARDFVQAAGFKEYQHALGHQIGRYAHDGGVLLGPKWERYGDSVIGAIEAGNVFTLELYVTTKNYGQVSLEEDVIVTKNGCEFLSHPQKRLICIG
jgi:methionine aminopeptidase